MMLDQEILKVGLHQQDPFCMKYLHIQAYNFIVNYLKLSALYLFCHFMAFLAGQKVSYEGQFSMYF